MLYPTEQKFKLINDLKGTIYEVEDYEVRQ